MSNADLQARLDQVVQAIDHIEAGGQSYTISSGDISRSYTRANLNDLYTQERMLLARLDRRKRGGFRFNYVR